MTTKQSNNGTWVLGVVIAIAFVAIVAGAASFSQREAVKKQCKTNDQVYVEESNTCRDKTVSEKFSEKCTDGITVGGTKYTCNDIKRAGLEKAFLDKNIVKHGDNIYEYGTYDEVSAGKIVGDYCLAASDTWYHLGERRCVVFSPTYFAYQGRNYFIDEKKDYNNGFVIYMYGNYGWDWFLAEYKDKGSLLVCGKITMYNGHPQIKATPSSILASPEKTSDGSYTVYRYSCS